MTASDTLLISDNFFGYARHISDELSRRGRSVLWLPDRPATDNRTKAMLRVAPALLAAKVERYVGDMIERARQHAIRDVLIIKGEAWSPRSIERLREAIPGGRFILYYWDSYLNMPADSPRKVDVVDRAFSFDPVDTRADARLAYRPLFYLDDYAHLPDVEPDIDVLFIGTVHTDRHAVLKRIARSLPASTRCRFLLYFPSRGIYLARRLLDTSFWRDPVGELIFSPLSKDQVQALVARSRIVVDIERPVQTGLTMRTLEMLGASRKIITTNPRVRDAEFFDPQNILVLDRREGRVDPEFLRTPFRPVSDNVRSRYSLSGWLDEVMR